MARCGNCNGDGKCPECHGKGKKWDSDIFDILDPTNVASGQWEECNECDGSGECNECHGTGEQNEND